MSHDEANSVADEAAHVTRVPLPVETRAPSGTTSAHLVDGLLVDPATRTDALDEAVATAAADGSPVTAIAVTHAHPDHVGAVAAYASLTGATVYAHADHVDRFREATGVDPDETVVDGDTVGSTDVRVWATPGHAPDHLVFVTDGPDRTAGIVGDLVVAEGSVAVAAPDGDLAAYLDSLDRVRDGVVDRLYPAHGPVVDDPAVTCRRLAEHRLDRERRVLRAVDAGASDVDAVLNAAYDRDLSGVADLARGTVRAHLEKLVAEGRVATSWTDED